MLAFEYQYNEEDAPAIAEMKRQRRIKNTYRILKKNDVVLLPDNALSQHSDMFWFDFYDESFKEKSGPDKNKFSLAKIHSKERGNVYEYVNRLQHYKI